MEDKQLQKLINDFGQLLNGNSILLQAYKTIIDEFQKKIDEVKSNASSGNE